MQSKFFQSCPKASISLFRKPCIIYVYNFVYIRSAGIKKNATKKRSPRVNETACRFPASLSTNAAIMAATVLASRLESTTDVFSFMLFSIEVFGLFPVFRRHLRHVSWRGHLLLTIFLVMSAGAGLSMAVSGGGLRAAITGAILGSFLTGLVMGICSWWLIGLQKYKNEIHGPWDPARPVIRRSWD